MQSIPETGIFALQSPCEIATKPTLWGKALAANEGLETAPEFCTSLERCGAINIDDDELVDIADSISSPCEKKWRREYGTQEAAFRHVSIRLSEELRNTILNVLSRCDPEGRHPAVRYDVLRAHLKAFQDAFICNALIGWPCRESQIPLAVRSPSASHAQAGTSGVLKILRDIERHKCWFSPTSSSPLIPSEEPDWRIDNLGLENYKNLLLEIWDPETGKLHFDTSSEPAVWIVSGIAAEHLERFAKDISELALPLKNISEDHKGLAESVLNIVRINNLPWKQRTVCWPFAGNLEKIMLKLEQAQAAAEELLEASRQTGQTAGDKAGQEPIEIMIDMFNEGPSKRLLRDLACYHFADGRRQMARGVLRAP